MKFSGVLVASCSEVFQQLNRAVLLSIFGVDARRIGGEYIHVPDFPCALAKPGKRLKDASSEAAILEPEGLQRGFHFPRVCSKIVHLLGRGSCRHVLKELAKPARGFLNSLEIKGHELLLARRIVSRFSRVRDRSHLFFWMRGKSGGCRAKGERGRRARVNSATHSCCEGQALELQKRGLLPGVSGSRRNRRGQESSWVLLAVPFR